MTEAEASEEQQGQGTEEAPDCAHCTSAYAMTRQAFENQTPPPDAIKAALLMGFVVGRGHAKDVEAMPCCDDCRAQIDHLERMIFQMLSAEGESGEGASAAGDGT